MNQWKYDRPKYWHVINQQNLEEFLAFLNGPNKLVGIELPIKPTIATEQVAKNSDLLKKHLVGFWSSLNIENQEQLTKEALEFADQVKNGYVPNIDDKEMLLKYRDHLEKVVEFNKRIEWSQ